LVGIGGNKGKSIGGDDISEEGTFEEFGSALRLPSVSSKINFPDPTPTRITCDLWVVGAGTLGELAAQQWVERQKTQKQQQQASSSSKSSSSKSKTFAPTAVIAETRTTARHASFQAKGITPRTRDQRTLEDDFCAKNVLVSLPPSAGIGEGPESYLTQLCDACRLWAGPLGGGKLVFTSSTAVYGESSGNTVNEKFRVDTRSARSTKMLACEEEILHREGTVVRLAGLYSTSRGPHTYWLKAGAVDGAADGVLNMLHYEDAAAAAVAALLNGKCNTIYLASDDVPVTREEVCAAALASKQYGPDVRMPTFSSPTGPAGKKCDSTWTRKELQWKPKYRFACSHIYIYNIYIQTHVHE